LKIDPNECFAGEEVRVSVTVTNTGNCAGDEVVQLYLRDCVSSVTRPVKELKGFQRLFLQSGEHCVVPFVLTPKALSLLNAHMRWVIEPGEFEVMVGGSSETELTAQFKVLPPKVAQ
jgi:beta-glucosidase